ncbi:MAG: ABC transporter substrate-binding protein [Syntrophorhabdales bacterium]|jgi:branched-chain amino acid transport system substrate-binding protein
MKRRSVTLKLLGVVLSAALLVGAMGTFHQTWAAPAKHVKIGSVMPITGPLAVLGLAFNRGWQLYLDKINSQGGLKIGDEAYVFDLISEDSKLSAEGASTAAKKLINQDKVDYVVGGIMEFELEAIYQVTSARKVPFIIANINVPGHQADVSPKKPFLVRLFYSHDDSHSIDLDYLVKAYPKAKKMVIVAPDVDYDRMIEHLTAQAKAVGIDVAGVAKWAFGTTDFIPTYTKALAMNPEVIWAMVSGQATYQLMAARQLGFKGPFISNVPLGPEVFQHVVNDPTALTDVITNGVDLSKPNEAIKDVMERWQAKFKDPFVSDCLAAWDQTWILTQAMEKAKSVAGDKVIAALETMTVPGSLKTCFGPGQMGGAKRFGVNRVLTRPLPLTRIMNGKTEFIGFMTVK